jgi:hypothetical protein
MCFGTSLVSAKDPSQDTPLPPVSPKALVTVGTMTGTGSGTIFAVRGDTAYILTAEHVVYPYGEKDKTVWVIHGRKRVEATIHATDGPVDIAVISVKGLEKPEAIKFAEKEFEQGDTQFHFGRATGPQEGKVLGFHDFKLRGRTAYSDVLSVPGDSGALTCNVRGELVNLHIGRVYKDKKSIDRDPGHGIGVNLEQIKKFTAPYMKD